MREARNHFNCQSMNGVALENGSQISVSSSHLESMHYGNEIMNAGFKISPVLSKITALLINSSWWYLMDLKKTEPLMFGKQ